MSYKLRVGKCKAKTNGFGFWVMGYGLWVISGESRAGACSYG